MKWHSADCPPLCSRRREGIHELSTATGRSDQLTSGNAVPDSPAAIQIGPARTPLELREISVRLARICALGGRSKAYPMSVVVVELTPGAKLQRWPHDGERSALSQRSLVSFSERQAVRTDLSVTDRDPAPGADRD